MITSIVLGIIALVSLYVIFWQGCLLFSIILHAPTVYSNENAIADALALAGLKKGERVMDLGCGNASSLIIAAKKFGASGVGVEISPYCVIASKLNIIRAGLSKDIKVHLGDFKKVEGELQKADVVYLYLLESGLKKIEPWFFRNLKKGARVVSMSFKFTEHEPAKIIETKNLGRNTQVRLYLN